MTESVDTPADTRRTVARIAVAAVVLLTVGLVVGMTRDDGGASSDVADETLIDPPVVLPDLVLTDTDGAPFDLRRDTAGRTTLLYLGYVNCPDVCPITSAVIAHTLDNASADVRDAVQVVFVTVDPERDSPEQIRAFLDSFSPSFIGLRATPEDLETLQVTLNAPSAVAEPPDDAGGYLVGHASAVYVFGPDGVAHRRFPFGTRQSDWAEILPTMVDS